MALGFLFYIEKRFLTWFVVVGHMGAAEEGHVSPHPLHFILHGREGQRGSFCDCCSTETAFRQLWVPPDTMGWKSTLRAAVGQYLKT